MRRGGQLRSALHGIHVYFPCQSYGMNIPVNAVEVEPPSRTVTDVCNLLVDLFSNRTTGFALTVNPKQGFPKRERLEIKKDDAFKLARSRVVRYQIREADLYDFYIPSTLLRPTGLGVDVDGRAADCN